MEKYSVLMSVYYKENPDYFRASIESMIHQTIMPEQIVIVKDGKLTQKLDEVIDEYIKGYKNLFTIVTLEKNGGLGHALNEGLKVCRCELVARMDTDDISLPDRCEKQLKKFAANINLCICGTQINEFIDFPENVVSSREVPTEYEEIKKFARRRSPFNHPTVMYKKSEILKYGGYAEYGRKEDLDLFIRLINEGLYVENVGEALLLYRTNNENLMRRKSWKNCSEYIVIMYGFYKKKYISLNDFIFVLLGQSVMYIMPRRIASYLSNRFLRKRAN